MVWMHSPTFMCWKLNPQSNSIAMGAEILCHDCIMRALPSWLYSYLYRGNGLVLVKIASWLKRLKKEFSLPLPTLLLLPLIPSLFYPLPLPVSFHSSLSAICFSNFYHEMAQQEDAQPFLAPGPWALNLLAFRTVRHKFQCFIN